MPRYGRHAKPFLVVIALASLVVFGYLSVTMPIPRDTTINSTADSSPASLSLPPEPENFTIQSAVTPANETYPIEVQFRRPSNGSWNTTATVVVNESEEFHPNLTEGQRYGITVTNTVGTQRWLGTYEYQGHGAEILLDTCCLEYLSERDLDV